MEAMIRLGVVKSVKGSRLRRRPKAALDTRNYSVYWPCRPQAQRHLHVLYVNITIFADSTRSCCTGIDSGAAVQRVYTTSMAGERITLVGDSISLARDSNRQVRYVSIGLS